MLYLYGEPEIAYIFDDLGLEGIANRAYETYKKRPGFFTPYKDGYEFAGELLAPVIYPMAGLVTAGYALFAAALSAFVFAGSLLVALSLVLCGDALGVNEAMKLAGQTLYTTGIALLTGAIGLTLAMISLPHSVISLFTRSAATVVALVTGDTDSYPAKDEEAYSEEEHCCFSTI